MNRYKITVIAAVSSLFIGFNVGWLVYQESPLLLAAIMGIAAGVGSMMIELTVPESLITIWGKAGGFYKILAVCATLTTPLLLIAALPSHHIARFSVAFIAAALISYVMFYSNEFSKAQTRQEIATAEDEKQWQRQKEMLELEHRLQLDNDLAIKKEDNKKEVKLAKIGTTQSGDASPESIQKFWQDNPGISYNQLGFQFGIDPKTAKRRLEIAQNGK